MAEAGETEERTGGGPARPGIPEVYAFVIVAALLIVFYLARGALASYLLAFLGIYFLLPIVRLIERRLPQIDAWTRFRRPLAVLVTMVGTLVVLAIVLSVLIKPVVDQTVDLFNNLDSYWASLREEYPSIVRWYEDNIPQELRTRIETTVRNLGADVVPGVTRFLAWLVGATGSLISALIALIAVPLFIVYYLLEEPRTLRNVRRELPGRWIDDAISMFHIVDRIMGSYTRGVILMALIVGTITGFGYWLIGVDLWLPLGFIAFAGEIVPIIGPWIAFGISFPVVLATEPELAIPAVILFAVVQALEGWFLAPKIEGGAVRFTSAGTLFLLSIGGALAGSLGVVFALPFAAIVRALIVYGAHRFDGHSPSVALSLVPIFDGSAPARDET